MSTDRGKLGNFLKEVINWNWADFCRAEKDSNYTAAEATVFGLVRTTSEGKLGAIKLAIDRVDGKVVTPIRFEYPKIYNLYPHAESVAGIPIGDMKSEVALPKPEEFEEPEVELKEDLLTFTLRKTLKKMADTDRKVVPLILSKKREIEDVLNGHIDTIKEVQNVPLVKSVIAANLLHLAIEENNFEAITEVFDQIDGKLVETFKVGEDLYMVQYTKIAPEGAVRNEDGIYMMENTELAEQWKQKLETK